VSAQAVEHVRRRHVRDEHEDEIADDLRPPAYVPRDEGLQYPRQLEQRGSKPFGFFRRVMR
jgi:hypothetical protein